MPPSGGDYRLQCSLSPYGIHHDPAVPAPPRDAVDNPDLAWVCGRVMRPLNESQVGYEHGWTAQQWLSNRDQISGKPMYYNHKARSHGAIGSLHSPYVDSEGWLCVSGFINRTDERAAAIYERMCKGEVCDLSIGYDVVVRNSVAGGGRQMIERIIIKEVSVTEKGKIEGSRITFLNSAVSQGDDADDTTTTTTPSTSQASDSTTKAHSAASSLLERYHQRHSSQQAMSSTTTTPAAAATAPATPAPAQQQQQQVPAVSTPITTPPTQQAQQTQQPQQSQQGAPAPTAAATTTTTEEDMPDIDVSTYLDGVDMTSQEQVVKLAMKLVREKAAKEAADRQAFTTNSLNTFQQVAGVFKAHGLAEEPQAQAFFTDPHLAYLNQPMLKLAQQAQEQQARLAQLEHEKQVLEETVRGMSGSHKRANTARQSPATSANAARSPAAEAAKPTALAQTTSSNAPAPTTPQDQEAALKQLMATLQSRAQTLPKLAADASVGAFHPLDPYRIDPSRPLDLTKESSGVTLAVRNSALTQAEDSILCTPGMVARAHTPFNPNVSKVPRHFECGKFADAYRAYRPKAALPFMTASGGATPMDTPGLATQQPLLAPNLLHGTKRGTEGLQV